MNDHALSIALLVATAAAVLAVARVRVLTVRAARAAKDRDRAVERADVVETLSAELRAPMTIVLGAVRTLDEHELVPAAGQSLLGDLGRAAERMDDLIAALVAAAGGPDERRRGEQREVDLRRAFDQVVSALTRLDAPSRVGFEAFPDARAILSVPGVINLLLRFVVENALTFSPPHSPVLVLARRVDDHVEIRVRDWGQGIGEEFIGRAFDAFTREDLTRTRTDRGLGLGLFAAHNLAERLGGRIRLRRHPAGGTEAVIALPQRRAEDLDLEGNAPAGPPFAVPVIREHTPADAATVATAVSLRPVR